MYIYIWDVDEQCFNIIIQAIWIILDIFLLILGILKTEYWLVPCLKLWTQLLIIASSLKLTASLLAKWKEGKLGWRKVGEGGWRRVGGISPFIAKLLESNMVSLPGKDKLSLLRWNLCCLFFSLGNIFPAFSSVWHSKNTVRSFTLSENK